MIRTEDDVRAALRAAEVDAPEVGRVLARLEQATTARRRRRVAGGAVLTAFAVAVAVAAPAVWSGYRGTERAADQPAITEEASMRLDFTVEPPTGYQQYMWQIEAGYRVLTLHQADGMPPGIRITVYDRGVRDAEFEAARTQIGVPVDVGGRPGFDTSGAEFDRGLPVSGQAIAWEYAPDSWASVMAVLLPEQSMPTALLLDVATRTRFGEQRAMRVPYWFGYLPDGLRPVYGVEMASAGTFEANSRIEYARRPADRADRGRFIDLDDGQVPSGSGLLVKVEERGPGDPPTDPGLIGVLTYPRQGAVVVEYVGYRLEIVVAYDDLERYDRAVLERIVAGMTFAPDVADISTWFDLAG